MPAFPPKLMSLIGPCSVTFAPDEHGLQLRLPTPCGTPPPNEKPSPVSVKVADPCSVGIVMAPPVTVNESARACGHHSSSTAAASGRRRATTCMTPPRRTMATLPAVDLFAASALGERVLNGFEVRAIHQALGLAFRRLGDERQRFAELLALVVDPSERVIHLRRVAQLGLRDQRVLQRVVQPTLLHEEPGQVVGGNGGARLPRQQR